MILGIGTDIEQVDRIQASIQEYGDHFLNKIFTEQEQRYCMAKPFPAQHFAARFAAKEAVAKALGTGWGAHFSWKDAEVVKDDLGRPSILFSTALVHRLPPHTTAHLSISHAGGTAIAFVVLETHSRVS